MQIPDKTMKIKIYKLYSYVFWRLLLTHWALEESTKKVQFARNEEPFFHYNYFYLYIFLSLQFYVLGLLLFAAEVTRTRYLSSNGTPMIRTNWSQWEWSISSSGKSQVKFKCLHAELFQRNSTNIAILTHQIQVDWTESCGAFWITNAKVNYHTVKSLI